MKIATFYPGPSRVYSNLTEFIYEAYMKGVMSINHRSDAFMGMMFETKRVLKEKLLIPDDYEIVFTSSATESWEIIAQSLTREHSQHFYNGAFGEKWHLYASHLVGTSSVEFELNTEMAPDGVSEVADMICVTQNETSNGTQISMESLKALKEHAGDRLIAVDATSSMAGIHLDFSLGDIWYASVQKCFGLPAGMGVMVLSPAAIERAYELNEKSHYNSLVNILDNAKKNQTPYTPNVLNIYLIKRTQEVSKGIRFVHERALKRYQTLSEVIAELDDFEFLVSNPAVRSQTVLAIKCEDPQQVRIKSEEYGIILGNGYGQWKPETFRIANFPAIKSKEIEKLNKHLLQHYQ